MFRVFYGFVQSIECTMQSENSSLALALALAVALALVEILRLCLAFSNPQKAGAYIS